jgi:hypothetical protein
MNTTIFVLLMIWSTSASYGGIAVVQQEFSSREACEAVRAELAKAHNGTTRVLGVQGCFKK